MLHQLTFRHSGPIGTALCSCGQYIRAQDMPHGRILLDDMKDYMAIRLSARPRRYFHDGSGYEIKNLPHSTRVKD